MKKIMIMMISLSMLPMLSLAKNNKQLSKWEQNLQRRNVQTVERLEMLGRVYQDVEKAEEKAGMGENIAMEVRHWYDENRMTVMQAKQEEAMKENKAFGEVTPEEQEKAEQAEQKKMVEEIKAGKIPEVMLKVLPAKDAQRFKQRSEMAEQRSKHSEKIKALKAKRAEAKKAKNK